MDTMLKEAIASLFCYVIKEGGRNVDTQRAIFCRFMQQNFKESSCETLMELYEETLTKVYNIDTQISIIANGLSQKTYEKVTILKQVKYLVSSNNPRQGEYAIVDKLKIALEL